MDNLGSYTAYVGLIIAILNHFGWSILPADAETVVAGIITLIGIITAHVQHNAVIAQARLAGMHI